MKKGSAGYLRKLAAARTPHTHMHGARRLRPEWRGALKSAQASTTRVPPLTDFTAMAGFGLHIKRKYPELYAYLDKALHG